MQQDNKTISMTAQELLDKGLHCYSKKDLEGALFFLEPLFLLEKNNVDLINTIINILQEIKSYIKAESYINVLLGLDADNDSFQFLQAENLFFQKSYVKAVPLYLQLHSLHPLNTHILQRLLAIYSKQNKRSEVKQIRELLAQAEATTSDAQAEIEATVEVALSLVERGESDQAKMLLESVLLFDEHNINANGIYGALLNDEGNYEKALYYLDKISNGPFDDYLLIYIKCLKEIRGVSSAVSYLEAKVKDNVKNSILKKELGYLYFDDQQYSRAYENLKSVKNEFQDHLEFSRVLVLSRYLSINENKKWMNKDKLDAAAAELQVIYKNLPNDEHILIELIKYYLNIGDIKKSYELVCNGYFKSEEVREWNKTPYYNALRDRNRFFNSYIYGRVARPLLVDYHEVKSKIWNGEPLAGKKVVILREQGIGDEIIFASNYNWIIEQAKHVDIFCSPRLKNEFSRMFPKANFHFVIEDEGLIYMPQEKEHYLQSADFLILAGDLPALYYQTHGMPLYKENYYSVTKEKKAFWKGELADIVNNNKPKIGIIWRSGNIDSSRSVYYLNYKEVAAIIAALPEVEFVSCMYVECKKEISSINKITKRKIIEIPELDQKNDFENTAAMLSCLDLVVGAYTATLVLALATGTPVVGYAADYLKEDRMLVKEAFYHNNAAHISLPVNDIEQRAIAIDGIINLIKESIAV